MQPTAMAATEPTNDQDNGISGAINVFPPTLPQTISNPLQHGQGLCSPLLTKNPFLGVLNQLGSKRD